MDEIKFETMRNGYNRYQVDDKISQLTEEIETLQKKLSLYSNRLDEVEKQSAIYKEKYLTSSNLCNTAYYVICNTLTYKNTYTIFTYNNISEMINLTSTVI